jgi:hypothetical protein
MQTLSHHILRRDALGTLIWVEAAASMETAKARVLRIAERFPGEYVVFHQATAKIVANLHFKQNALFSVRSESTHLEEKMLSGS